MMKNPPAVVLIGEEQDDVIEGALSDLIPRPEKPYKGVVVDNLAKAMTSLLALMDLDYEVEPYGQAVEQLDGEMVRLLAMLAEAAADYGKPLPLSPEEIRGDNELVVITDHLSMLSRDRDFRDFLEEEVEDEDEEMEEDGEVEEVDEEALLMSRM